MSRIELAVIGYGHLGSIHTRLLNALPQVQLVAVADPDRGARNRAREEFGCDAFADYRQLEGKVRGVIVAAPTPLHHEIGMFFLQRGVHCFLEKPIAASGAQAEQLVDAAQQSGCVLQVGQVERFNPAFLAATQSTQQRPRFIEATRLSGYTFRSIDVGVVLDLMIHDIDLVAALVPGQLIDARAIGCTVFGPHEDIAHARLQFDDGTVANLTASRCSIKPSRQICWYTENSFVSVDLAQHQGQRIVMPEWMASGAPDARELSPERQRQIKEGLFSEVMPPVPLEIQPHNAIAQEHGDFLRCLQTGATPRVDGRAGQRALAIAEIVLAQVRAHRWSDLATLDQQNLEAA